MDLLLDLAERQRVDLGRISVLDLVGQFVAAMDRLAGRVTPERHAEWLVLAARLVLLRSRLMLPTARQKLRTPSRTRRGKSCGWRSGCGCGR